MEVAETEQVEWMAFSGLVVVVHRPQDEVPMENNEPKRLLPKTKAIYAFLHAVAIFIIQISPIAQTVMGNAGLLWRFVHENE